VGRWWLSVTIGPLAVLRTDGAGPLLPGADEPSERTRELVDTEAHRIVEEAHRDVTDLLRFNRKRLDALASALLEKETLDEDEAYAVAGVEHAQTEEPPLVASAAARNRWSSIQAAPAKTREPGSKTEPGSAH